MRLALLGLALNLAVPLLLAPLRLAPGASAQPASPVSVTAAVGDSVRMKRGIGSDTTELPARALAGSLPLPVLESNGVWRRVRLGADDVWLMRRDIVTNERDVCEQVATGQPASTRAGSAGSAATRCTTR